MELGQEEATGKSKSCSSTDGSSIIEDTVIACETPHHLVFLKTINQIIRIVHNNIQQTMNHKRVQVDSDSALKIGTEELELS